MGHFVIIKNNNRNETTPIYLFTFSIYLDTNAISYHNTTSRTQFSQLCTVLDLCKCMRGRGRTHTLFRFLVTLDIQFVCTTVPMTVVCLDRLSHTQYAYSRRNIIINLTEIIWDDMIEFAIITLLYWHLFYHHIRWTKKPTTKNGSCQAASIRYDSWIKLKYVFYCVWHDISEHWWFDYYYLLFTWWHYIWL